MHLEGALQTLLSFIKRISHTLPKFVFTIINKVDHVVPYGVCPILCGEFSRGYCYRHEICHGRMNIVNVKLFLARVNYSPENTLFLVKGLKLV